MKIRFGLVALLALGLAGPALAAKTASLTVTNNTIGGPGTASVAIGGTEQVFSHPTGTDVCVTVLNTGKVPVGVSITGVSSASSSVPAGGGKTVCSDDTTAIDLSCAEESTSCAAQWRVDEN